IRAHLIQLREEDDAAHARQTAELGYLANALMAGCSFQSRRFRSAEAADAVLAVCNLGLDSWPARWPPARDLVTIFRVGWSVLHESVCLHAVRRLVEALATLEMHGGALRDDLRTLRRRIEEHAEAPWRVREDLDVIALLDPPTWATLLGLLDECPTVPRRA